MHHSSFWTFFFHRLVKAVLAVFLLLPISTDNSLAQAVALPVKDETLGVWHYLWPLEIYSGGGAIHGRPVSAPTAVEFGGGRIAVILPGSEKVAEFKGGAFGDLSLPAFASPLSLAVDRQGKLYCLLQRIDHLKIKDGWRERWVLSLSESGGWSEPVQVPFPDADRIEFDTKNRLWALGPAPRAAVFLDGGWDRCPTGSEAPPPSAGAVRLASGENDDVILFDAGQEYQQMPLPSGVVVYHEGKFAADPGRDVTALRADQKHRDDALTADHDFERCTGYICRALAQNTWHFRPITVLRTATCVLVSFGNEGLAWVNADALRTAPKLEDDEWEEVSDVCVPPATDADGALWLVRDNPRRFVKIEQQGTHEYPAVDLPVKSGISSIDFDQRGRPWVHGWSGQEAATLLDGDKLRLGRSEIDLLRAERNAFQPGQVFLHSDLAVKTPAGAICLLDYEHLMIGDAVGVHAFSAEQISPGHTKHILMPKHGYNPFRGGEPQFDSEGSIYTKIDGKTFRYLRNHWHAALPFLLPLKWVPPPQGDTVAPYETRVLPLEGRGNVPEYVFRCLHFYERKVNGSLEQIDHGLNPLAFYPFWTGWYNSPGWTRPSIDPAGHIWISPRGPYGDEHDKWKDRVWMRLRQGRSL